MALGVRSCCIQHLLHARYIVIVSVATIHYLVLSLEEVRLAYTGHVNAYIW